MPSLNENEKEKKKTYKYKDVFDKVPKSIKNKNIKKSKR